MKQCFSGATGSLMGQIMALTLTPDQFIDPPKAEGIFEVIEQRMSEFERAVYTVISLIAAKKEKMIEEIKGGDVTVNKIHAMKAEIRQLDDQRTMLKNLLFLSIRDRLNFWGERLGVSEGFKIIIPEEEDPLVRLPKEIRELVDFLKMEGSVVVEEVMVGRQA